MLFCPPLRLVEMLLSFETVKHKCLSYSSAANPAMNLIVGKIYKQMLEEHIFLQLYLKIKEQIGKTDMFIYLLIKKENKHYVSLFLYNHFTLVSGPF